MSKTDLKHKKNFSYEQDEVRSVKKRKPILNKKHSKQIDNLLRSKNVSRLLDYSEDKL